MRTVVFRVEWGALCFKMSLPFCRSHWGLQVRGWRGYIRSLSPRGTLGFSGINTGLNKHNAFQSTPSPTQITRFILDHLPGEQNDIGWWDLFHPKHRLPRVFMKILIWGKYGPQTSCSNPVDWWDMSNILWEVLHAGLSIWTCRIRDSKVNAPVPQLCRMFQGDRRAGVSTSPWRSTFSHLFGMTMANTDGNYAP